jgi:hypothetical protein
MADVGLRYVCLAVPADLYEMTYGPEPAPPGAWLADYDPDADGGRGRWSFSIDPAKAMRFASNIAAIQTWRLVSESRPVRSDGKPNRPLTCLTVITDPL